MGKKGIALETVVIAILSLIVLIVLAYIFRDQIGSAANSIFRIGEEGEQGARGQKCVTLITATSRQCVKKECEKDKWREVYPPQIEIEEKGKKEKVAKFLDCDTTATGGYHCCERVYTGEETKEESIKKVEEKKT